MQKLNIENLLMVCSEIEGIVQQYKVSYVDACIQYSDDKKVEIEYVAEVISQNQNILSKLEKEAQHLNIIKKSPRLEFSA